MSPGLDTFTVHGSSDWPLGIDFNFLISQLIMCCVLIFLSALVVLSFIPFAFLEATSLFYFIYDDVLNHLNPCFLYYTFFEQDLFAC